MKKPMSPLVICILAIAGWQIGISLLSGAERNRKYAEAREYADSVNKPFLVVGGPWGMNPLRVALGIPAHGCGDVCLDTDAEACHGCNTIEADVRAIPFPDAHFGAVICPHVLEHMRTVVDAAQAAQELYRVADKVWILSPSKAYLMAWLHPDHYLWVRQENDRVYIEPGPRYSGHETSMVLDFRAEEAFLSAT